MQFYLNGYKPGDPLVARQLIDFDRKFSRLFSGRTTLADFFARVLIDVR